MCVCALFNPSNTLASFEKKHNLFEFFLFVAKSFPKFNMISQKLDFGVVQSYPDNGD